MKKENKKGKILLATMLTGALLATSAVGLTNYSHNKLLQENTAALVAATTIRNDITEEYGLVIDADTRLRSTKDGQEGKLFTDTERILKTEDGIDFIEYFGQYYTSDGRTLYRVVTDKDDEVEYTFEIEDDLRVGEEARERKVTNVKTGESEELHEYFFWLKFRDNEGKIVDEEKQVIITPAHQVTRITSSDPTTLQLPENERIVDIQIMESKKFSELNESIYYGDRLCMLFEDEQKYPYTLSR